MNVVVTGKIPGESRPSAEARLRELGAHVQSSVVGTTDLLVCGVDVGRAKLDAAAKHGVRVVGWHDAAALLAGDSNFTILAAAPEAARDRPAQPVRASAAISPMLCKQTDELPAGPGWVYEIKWDGFRGIAHVDGAGGCRIDSRQGNDLTARFAQVAEELARLPVQAVLDGELVALDETGRADLQRLGDGSARFMAFDLLELAGEDVRRRPLAERRALLDALLEGAGGRVGVSPQFDDGETLLAFAVENQLEGIVAKRSDSIYRDGARGPAWLKLKVRQSQEFVVVGFTKGKGMRASSAGAFLLAVNDEEKRCLVYCGSVGTGGSEYEWKQLVAMLEPIGGAAVDVGETPLREFRDVTWVRPDVVVQVQFQHWTRDGRLWHPSLQGVRTDKRPCEVVREAA